MITIASAYYYDIDRPFPRCVENPLSIPVDLLNEIVADPYLRNASSLQDKLSALGYAGTLDNDCVNHEDGMSCWEFYISPLTTP
jgi:hypothetical protein